MASPVEPQGHIRSPAELMLKILENCSEGWIHKTKAIERSDMAPGNGAIYIRQMIKHGFLESYRSGRITHVRPTPAGFELLAEGKSFFAKIDQFLDDLTESRR